MRSSYTPPAYFAISENFSYREYLEQRSHFDRIDFAIDRQTAALVGGLNRLSELAVPDSATANALEELKVTIASGLSEANQSLQQISINTANIAEDTLHIRMGVNELIRETRNASALLEWGFSATLKELLATNEKLDRIINALENQDQTWAYSQYKIAYRLLHDEGLNSEALDYVTRAIEGHGGNAGYPLEPNFFLLRGAIRLGVTESIEIDLVDTQKAIADFNLAARYSRTKDGEIHIVALSFLGQAHYCQGNLKDSVECFTKAAERDPENGHINFLLSKALIRLGEKHKAMHAFRISLREDWMFAYRASADADFASVADLRLKELVSYRNELADHLAVLCKHLDVGKIHSAAWRLDRSPTAANGVEEGVERAILEMNALCQRKDAAQIEELASACKVLSTRSLSALADTISRSRARLVERARRKRDDRISELNAIAERGRREVIDGNNIRTVTKFGRWSPYAARDEHNKDFNRAFNRAALFSALTIGVLYLLFGGPGFWSLLQWIFFSIVWYFGLGFMFYVAENVMWRKRIEELKSRTEKEKDKLSQEISRVEREMNHELERSLETIDEALRSLRLTLAALEQIAAPLDR